MVAVGETLTPTEFEAAPPVLKPVPVHEVALLLVQVRVEDWPSGIEVEDADKVPVGAGLACALVLTCPAINNGEASKAIADTELRNMCGFLIAGT